MRKKSLPISLRPSIRCPLASFLPERHVESQNSEGYPGVAHLCRLRKEELLFLFRKAPGDMTTQLKRNHAAGVCLEEGFLCLLIESCCLARTHTLPGETDA